MGEKLLIVDPEIVNRKGNFLSSILGNANKNYIGSSPTWLLLAVDPYASVENHSLLREVFLVASGTDLDSAWLSRSSVEQAWRAVWEGGNNLNQNRTCSEMLKYALLWSSSHDSVVLVSCPHLLADTRIMASEACSDSPKGRPRHGGCQSLNSQHL